MTSEHVMKILTMSLFVLLKILCKDNSKRYLCMILSRSLVQIYLIQPRYIHTNYLFKILIRSCLQDVRLGRVSLIHIDYLILSSDHFYENINRIQLKFFALLAMNLFQYIMVKKMTLIDI